MVHKWILCNSYKYLQNTIINKPNLIDLMIQGNESVITPIDTPIRPREYSMVQDRSILNKILKGCTPKSNTTFCLNENIVLNNHSLNSKTEAKYIGKYPISHLLEAGLLVLNVEGILSICFIQLFKC